MYLESAATNWLGSQTPPPCMPEPLNIHKTNINQAKVDWASLLPMLMDTSLPVGERAWRMHATLASTVCILASTLRDETGIQHVGLTGGVFQNRLLSELIHTQLHALDFKVHLPQQVPMNDAGVSYGQVIQYLYTSHA
jgi:hydrogenase maturation protein HypF